MENTKHPNLNRIDWVDHAKALGMFLVYFGHIVQEISNKGFQSFEIMTKFIYSFHMPLFFILAGFFFKRRSASLIKEIKLLFLNRVLPVLYFGVISLPLWPILLYLANGFIDWPLILSKASNYLIGHPDLNTISWFLICLFVAEIFAAVILPSVDGIIVGLAVSFIFLRTGLVMTSYFPETVESLRIEKNFWYVHEAVVAFGLYTLGYSTFKLLRRMAGWKPVLRFSLLAAALILTLTTFNLNKPYENFVVIMKNSNHGNNWLFLLTAISGTLTVILLATIIPSNKILKFIGQNSLVFLCTSGIFHHFINPVFVKIMIPLVSESWMILLSFLFTVLTLVASIPIVIFLKKYTPQLVGIPQKNGPWLPTLISLNSSSDHLSVLDD